MISILPESEENVLGVQATKKLTAEDYETTWIPRLEAIIGQGQKVRCLLYLDEDFDGWEAGAMWDDAKFGLAHNKDFEKFAVVGGPKWTAWVAKLFSPFTPASVQTFEASDLAGAWAWVKS